MGCSPEAHFRYRSWSSFCGFLQRNSYTKVQEWRDNLAKFRDVISAGISRRNSMRYFQEKFSKVKGNISMENPQKELPEKLQGETPSGSPRKNFRNSSWMNLQRNLLESLGRFPRSYFRRIPKINWISWGTLETHFWLNH